MDVYLDVFKNLPQPALLVNKSNSIENTSLVAQELFSRVPGMSLTQVLDRFRNWLKTELDQFRNSGQSFHLFEKPCCFLKKGTVFYRIRLSRLDDNSNIIVLLSDITDQRNLLEDLRRHATIVNSSDDAITSFTLDGDFSTVNPGAEAIYGYSEKELVNKSFHKVVPSYLFEEFEGILDDVSKGKSIRNYETFRRTKQNTVIPVSVTYSPIKCFDDIIGIAAILRDITKRRSDETALVRSHQTILALQDETVKALSATLETRDLYTSGHQKRTSAISMLIGKKMGLEDTRLQGLNVAALLHDIGKIAIPMAILSKPARLTESEMGIVKDHPLTGFQILKNIPFPWPVDQTIVQHHERLDGSGYPYGLTNGNIITEARILAVADVLEAMTAHRPYRPGLGLKAAINEIKSKSNTAFDHNVCEALYGLIKSGAIYEKNGGIELCPSETN